MGASPKKQTTPLVGLVSSEAENVFRRGRHPHTLLELFKYIAENPESSERLLKRLQKPVAPKVALVENLVY